MKAIRVDEAGGAERLSLVNVPDPVPGRGEVVLKVHAAGVNFADVKMRRGDFPPPGGYPFLPGTEVAGQVALYGPDVEEFGTGEKLVALLPHGGGYAEMASCPVARIYRAPEDFTWEQAAAWPVNFLTAWFALTAHGRVETGETVLIHGAAGGVGTAAVQIATQLGAKVIATTSDDRKAQWLRELRVKEVCNIRQQDFREAVRGFTDGNGVDLVLDSVGGDVLSSSLETLAPFGRLVHFGSARGSASVDPDALMGRNLSVIGLNMDAFFSRTGDISQALDSLAEIHRETEMGPVIGKVLPLSEAAEAHRLLESRQAFGKIVLRVDA